MSVARGLVGDRVLLDEVSRGVQLQLVQERQSERLGALPLLVIRFASVKHQPGLRAKASDYLGCSEAVEARHS